MVVVIPPSVITGAQLAMKMTGIPASVTIAQWAIESGWGARVTGTYNVFGIKAVQGQSSTACASHEVINGERVPVTAYFANYGSLAEAFVAHARVLMGLPYMAARKCLPDVEAFVDKMAPVYATDPNYASLVMKIIIQHNLTQYDREVA
jgi:flagellum-specific peptidoglycan hydrolase FlgJ